MNKIKVSLFVVGLLILSSCSQDKFFASNPKSLTIGKTVDNETALVEILAEDAEFDTLLKLYKESTQPIQK